MTPNVESATSKLASAKGRASASATSNRTSRRSARRALAALVEQGGHVVRGGDLREAARGRQRGVAVAGSDVEHALARAHVHGLGERFADDLQRGADDGEIAAGPRGLLALLDGREVRGGRGGDSGLQDGLHEVPRRRVWGKAAGRGPRGPKHAAGGANDAPRGVPQAFLRRGGPSCPCKARQAPSRSPALAARTRCEHHRVPLSPPVQRCPLVSRCSAPRPSSTTARPTRCLSSGAASSSPSWR